MGTPNSRDGNGIKFPGGNVNSLQIVHPAPTAEDTGAQQGKGLVCSYNQLRKCG